MNYKYNIFFILIFYYVKTFYSRYYNIEKYSNMIQISFYFVNELLFNVEY